MTAFADEISSVLIGNPHSASTSSQLATSRIENIRLSVLQMFKADPADFDIVFVANATAGIKLVTEAFRAIPGGFNFIYHQSSHTSVIGVRQEARNSISFDDAAIGDWLSGHTPDLEAKSDRPTLLAYPAQSNLDGRRFSLQWCRSLRMSSTASSPGRNGGKYSLLDAAAYVSTASLDFSDPESAPDFTVLSFYKIFGFPDLGAVIVRRQSAPILLGRKYFGGGTVDAIVCGPDQWHAIKDQSVHEALEDGTLPIHSILALDHAMNTHLRLFGTMHDVAAHTSYLTKNLRHRLRALRHGNGRPLCVVYSNKSGYDCKIGSGAVIAFNIQDEKGAWVSLSEFQKLASLKGFHLRTGGICNPGGVSAALDLEPWEIKKNYSQGFRCGNDNDIIENKPTGVIRVSLGAMSIESDIDKLINFFREFYCGQSIGANNVCVQNGQGVPEGFIEDIIVYPIKSCRGFHVPKNVPWQLRAEGLMWDREWCLIHRATGRALTLKRYPRMTLLQPTIDLDAGILEISFLGHLSAGALSSISVPLLGDIDASESDPSFEWTASRVCEEKIWVQKYTSHIVNDFFSDALGVPCALARFLPNGSGGSLRSRKTQPRVSQQSLGQQEYNMPGSFPNLSSKVEGNPMVGEDSKILLSNESPILAVTTSSIRALSEAVKSSNGLSISSEVFRPNIVIGSHDQTPSYSEETWPSFRIGQLDFDVLGPCQRCHMICIDPKTGIKGAEPFVTLSKTRRFNGKVWFGIHITMKTQRGVTVRPSEPRVLQIGNTILPGPLNYER